MTRAVDPWWRLWHEIDGANIYHVDLTPDREREAHALSLLDQSEKERWNRFVSVKSRREFALCRAALRVILARHMGCTERQLSFGRLEHGKPFAKVNGQRVNTGFNVSHSSPHGLVAIARNGCLGIDVEVRAPQRDFEGIGSLVFGPNERRLLEIATGPDRMSLFYRLWSMKEALIKALGTGFSLNPSGFEIPGPMLQGDETGVFRFPHLPSKAWLLRDLGESRFAAALAYGLAPSSGSNPTSPEPVHMS